ncbi:MAG: glycosyltransferase family 4 protein [Armatimonadetes bacterium]|nr:glycosyltransferase family 4 protein [Armatimonadota bacterium]
MRRDGPLRIAYVDHAVDFGGAEHSLIELISRLDRTSFTPVILHTEGAKWLQSDLIADVEKIAAVSPHPLLEQKRDELSVGLLPLIGNTWTALRLSLKLRRALRRSGAQLVHTNSLKTHFVGGLAARLGRLPLIWHVRDLLAENEGYHLLRRAARLLRPRVIAISEAVAQQFAGLPVGVTVIPNGIPLDKFCPGPPSPQLRSELGLTADDRVLLMVSRLTPWKGHMTLLEAVALLADRWPRLKLVIVGEVAFWEADYEQQLKQRAAELGLTEQVIWTGFRSDVPQLLRLCDIFVLPSVREPFGRVIIEAMATGRPVVATESGGVPEIVVDGQTGLLVPPNDADLLAEAIEALLTDQECAQQMGAEGLARAHRFFSVDRVARQVQELYQRTLSKGR